MFLVKDLIAANVHSGQQKNKWNPRTSSYLYATHDEKHIIDLEQTIILLRRAMNFVKKVTSKRGMILYVPHVPDSKKGVLAEALTHVPKRNYVSKRSRNGIKGKTNWNSFYSQTYEENEKRLGVIRLKGKMGNTSPTKEENILANKKNSITVTDKNSWQNLFQPEQWSNILHNKKGLFLDPLDVTKGKGKKESNLLFQKKTNEKDNAPYTNLLGKLYGKSSKKGIPDGKKEKENGSQGSYWLREETELPFVPEALFVANLSVNKILIKEATKLQIPIIGILSNDSNPFGIHFPIPGNNNSAKASALYLKLLIKALSEGKKKELKQITSRKK